MVKRVTAWMTLGAAGLLMAASMPAAHGVEAAKPEAAPSAAPAAATRMLFDFENGKAGPFEGGKITTENAPDGKYALLADKQFLKADFKQDWSGYDLLKFDVFNPKDDPVMLQVELHDAETTGYWTRVNYSTVVPPGKSTVTMPTDIYVGEKARPGRSLIKSKVTFLAFAPASFPMTFDNLRLERLDTAAVKFDGLKAFDFGPRTSPVMPGYLGVDGTANYSKEQGYGWLKDTRGVRTTLDGLQPDALYEDFVATTDAEFQVDLPDGKYHVIMNIDSPGGYWGDVQDYQQRSVAVNGKTFVDEKTTLDEFKKQYFHNAHREDFPGVDTFKEYVEAMFHVKQFDVDVSGGKAVFEFRGEGRWPIALSALVIYPAEKRPQGDKFWAWTTAQRHAQFDNYFKQVMPKMTGERAPATGYRVFSRSFMTPPNALDGPRENEGIPKEGLQATVAPGEEGALTFSVQPSGDLGAIEATVSTLESGQPDARESVPPKVALGWLDYRITRVTTEGTVYRVAPRYWHSTPAPSAGKFPRTFWLRIRPAAGTLPGSYKGEVTIKAANKATTTFPITVNVLPFAIDPVSDVPAGPWGCSISLPWSGSDPEVSQWRASMLDKSMTVIREAGCSTLTGLPHIGMKAAKGKVTLDFSEADKEMKMLRAHGFTQMIDSYGAGLGYPMYGTANGPDEAFAKRAGFADMEAFLTDLYGQIETHAAANDWLPIAWNLCDEPLGAAAKGSALNAALHQKVADKLHLKYSVFTGATSMEGNDPKDPHYNLVRALGMPSLNLHDEASIKVIHDAGHKFSFYNGGNRWTFGRYMKALVVHDGLAYRTTWHFNVAAGDPYDALDCREDDYCWYNTDENQTMTPSLSLLSSIQPGLNDYRYLSTLQRLVKEKAGSPAADAAKKVFEEQIDLVAGKDRSRVQSPADYDASRAAVVKAILSLTQGK